MALSEIVRTDARGTHLLGMRTDHHAIRTFRSPGRPVFVTWRLAGSLPPGQSLSAQALSSGYAFVVLDRLLDDYPTGPQYLATPEVAEMVEGCIADPCATISDYKLHAYVVMPNHVHVLLTPAIALDRILLSIKSRTARKARAMLHLDAGPFWQEENYNHLVWDAPEFARIVSYIEYSPVRAGLIHHPAAYQWSSASSKNASTCFRWSAA